MTKQLADIPLVLFAKAPIAGEVKTRLIPDASAEQAAEIAKILLETTLTNVVEHWPGKVYLSVWQFKQHPFIINMLEKYHVELLHQSVGNLGTKMQFTFDTLGYPAAIMGCDAPLVEPQILKQAHTALQEGQHVIGPSEDGGYYLIGASGHIAPLFNDIEWGTDAVFEKTVMLAADHHIDLFRLSQSYDIDRWQDVLRASHQIKALKVYLSTL